MNIHILTTAAALSDQELLERLRVLAGREREATVELIAHLAALDARPNAYAAQGYGSLFGYCTQALRLSEDASCNRIEAARTCRRFPVVLEHLASGLLSLAAVRLLGRHLTVENHRTVLERACGRSRREIEALVAELAPRPDVPASVRKLPAREPTAVMPNVSPAEGSDIERPTDQAPVFVTRLNCAAPTSGMGMPAEPNLTIDALPARIAPIQRAVVQPTAPKRYRVQFTIGPQGHEQLRRAQALLRRELPKGDPGAIFERGLALLVETLEKTKAAATDRPRPIRPGTDTNEKAGRPSRYIPRHVKRAVWRRDAGQCDFVSASGRRCSERTFLEFHHIQPYALHGSSSVENISLRCWRHNRYEAEQEFGPLVSARIDEARNRSQTSADGERSARASPLT
jgi:hypothetical protein